MQEHRYEGPDVFTENVDEEQIKAAIADPRNEAVTVYKTGVSGTYAKNKLGQWQRVGRKPKGNRGRGL
jgi:hypothetical protein